MIWWGIGALMLFLLIMHLWRTYNHPATILGRQGANMNWVAGGTVKDSRGYRNTRLVRDGVEVELSYSPVEVRLVKPFQPQAFPDFLALERWLGAREAESHDAITDLEDDANSDTFRSQVENQIALRGYSDELLAVQGFDQEYCKILFRAWLAADKAEEDPQVVAAFTLTSLEYYDKNRDVALSYLKRLESGWNAMVANPHLAAQLKQNAVEAQQLEDKTDAYQAALAKAEKKSLAFLADNAVCESFSDSETQEKLYAWLLVYLTTHKAWKDSKTDIHQSFWNAFQRRIEVEMLDIKDYGHVDSRVVSTPDGGKALTHFSSNYWAKMDELANVLNSKGVRGLVRRLLDDMNSPSELEDAFASFFNGMSREAELSLVKMIADLA
ncbi:MAG TPA: hypothetical protein VF928_04075 [Usitatibacteraceae bacterium]